MFTSIGSVLLILGLVLLIGSQLAIALHAFTGNPLKGILCFVVPFYVYVYAKREPISKILMRTWYGGMALLILGGVLAS